MVQTANAQREAADVELQRALIAQEDAQRQAAEIRQSAEQESNAIIGEAKARRDEIRAAEQELRNRLQGLESVFRALDQGSVVPDEVS